MARVEVTIDSVRRGLLTESWNVILKEKLGERYVPIYVSPGQAHIIKRELTGLKLFLEAEGYDLFLAGTDITGFELESVIVSHFEDNTFYAKLLLAKHDESFEVDCPVAGALALSVRRKAPIFAQEEVLSKAGIAVPG